MIVGFLKNCQFYLVIPIYVSTSACLEKPHSKFLFSCYSMKHRSDGDCSHDSPAMGIPPDLKGNNELKIIYSYSVKFVVSHSFAKQIKLRYRSIFSFVWLVHYMASCPLQSNQVKHTVPFKITLMN